MIAVSTVKWKCSAGDIFTADQWWRHWRRGVVILGDVVYSGVGELGSAGGVEGIVLRA